MVTNASPGRTAHLLGRTPSRESFGLWKPFRAGVGIHPLDGWPHQPGCFPAGPARPRPGPPQPVPIREGPTHYGPPPRPRAGGWPHSSPACSQGACRLQAQAWRAPTTARLHRALSFGTSLKIKPSTPASQLGTAPHKGLVSAVKLSRNMIISGSNYLRPSGSVSCWRPACNSFQGRLVQCMNGVSVGELRKTAHFLVAGACCRQPLRSGCPPPHGEQGAISVVLAMIWMETKASEARKTKRTDELSVDGNRQMSDLRAKYTRASLNKSPWGVRESLENIFPAQPWLFKSLAATEEWESSVKALWGCPGCP